METSVVVRWVRPGAVRWSEDNQLFLVTPFAVHILTPTLAEKDENESKASFLKASVVNTDEKETVPWKISNGVRAIRRSVVLRTPEYVAAAWSPTHCSSTGGCILACVDTRGSVTLHIPESSPTEKIWQKYITLDAHVAKLWNALEKDLESGDVDMVETVSVAWSPKMDIQGLHGSLLTLGNQAGCATFWDISDPSNVRHVKTLHAADKDVSITQMSWSPCFTKGEKNVSYFVCGLSTGRISAFKAILNQSGSASVLDSVTPSKDIFKDRRFDPSLCTGFAWSYQEPQMETIECRLCIAKGRRVFVWNPETDSMLSWKGRSTFPITHIQWSDANTKIIVMFHDGKASVLNVTDDTLEEFPSDNADATYLSQNIIGQCHQQTLSSKDDEDDKGGKDGDAGDDGDDEEGDTLGSSQLRIISGDSSPDGYCTAFVYFFQGAFQVRDKQNALLTLTPSRSDSSTSEDSFVLDRILSNLKGLLSMPNLALEKNPSHYLWNILFYTANLSHDQFERLNVMDKVLCVFDDANRMDIDNPHTRAEPVNHSSPSVEEKLTIAMYRDAAITAERAVFFMWTHLKRLSLPTSFRMRLHARAEKSIVRIRAHVTRLILDQFIQQFSSKNSSKDIVESDQTVLLLTCDSVVRMVLLQPQAAQDLIGSAQSAIKVYKLLKDAFPKKYGDLDQPLQILSDFSQGRDVTNLAGTFESKREHCPACDAPVPFEDETTAMCNLGHTFGRCSTTLQITSWSLQVCNGCGLKVTTPSPDSSNKNGKSSWMDSVLRASPLCVFCLERRHSVLI